MLKINQVKLWNFLLKKLLAMSVELSTKKKFNLVIDMLVNTMKIEGQEVDKEDL
jgi:hypothetical protein